MALRAGRKVEVQELDEREVAGGEVDVPSAEEEHHD
jgi:hypothetical protein